MALQQDSIIASNHSAKGDSGVVAAAALIPAKVLSRLPENATPAQQDSAIQSHFKAAEIHWSERPDTLHLPGHDKGRNMMDVDLPQYYRESYFSRDSLLHPELPGGRYGVPGDPVPYNVHNDDVITSLLLACFVIAVISIAHARNFFAHQLTHFFYLPHEGSTSYSATASEQRTQTFLVGVAALLLALLYYFYTLEFIGDTFVLTSPYYLILIYLGIIAGYLLLKILLYTIVNAVFFNGKRNGQWIRSLLFITSVEGIFSFPIVLIIAYTTQSIQNVVVYFIILLIFVKLLTFYKTYAIFFRRNVVRLQIILYFCALELVPMLALWSILDITANVLKIKF